MNAYDGMWPPPMLVPDAYVYDHEGNVVGDARPEAGERRVRHDDYGDGTVLQVDGSWLLVQFDGQVCATPGVHADDVEEIPR